MTDYEKIYKRALFILASRIEKESCYYCPYYQKDSCELIEGSSECIDCLVNMCIEEARHELIEDLEIEGE